MGNDFEPKLVAFCCQHSAWESAEIAAATGLRTPGRVRLVQVPCTGRLGIETLVKPFEKEADGVLVLACHRDNCKYLHGNNRAQKRVAFVEEMLNDLGIDPQRIQIHHLSSNMASEFHTIITKAFEEIQRLGPFNGTQSDN